MAEPKDMDENLSRASDLPSIGRALEIIEHEVQQQKEVVENRIFNRLDQGEELDGQLAIQSWVELYAYHRIERRLLKQQKRAQNAGEQLQGKM